MERVRYIRDGVRGGGAGARAGGVQVCGMPAAGYIVVARSAALQLLTVEQPLFYRPSVLVGKWYRVNRIDAGSRLTVVILLTVYLRRCLLYGGIVGVDRLLTSTCTRLLLLLLLLPVLRRVAVEHVLALLLLGCLLMRLRSRSRRHSLSAQRAGVAYAAVASRWLRSYFLARQRTAAHVIL